MGGSKVVGVNDCPQAIGGNVILTVQVASIYPDGGGGIKLEGGKIARYRSKIDPVELLALAKKELSVPIPHKNLKAISEAKSKNAQYIIFLLALGAGLRRNEIDKLEWESILWGEAKIRIQATRYFEPKTEDSAGDVDIDSGLLDILKKYKDVTKSPFGRCLGQ